MKKLIAILAVMIVIAGAVFATEATVNEETQKITLSTTVKESLPQFLMVGTLNSNYTAGRVNGIVAADNFTGTALTSEALNSTASIADEDINAYFTIYQNTSKLKADGTTMTYARTQMAIDFTFAFGPLTQQDVPQGKTAKTVAGELVTASAATAGTFTVGGNDYDNQISVTYTAASKKFTAVYDGRVDNDQEIGTFQIKWAKDPTVPNGTYKADITVNIDVQ